MSELPEGWAEVPLSDVVDVLDSKRVPLNADERASRIKDKKPSELIPYYGATGQVGYMDDHLFNESLILLGEDGVPFLDPLKHKAYRIEGKTWVNNHAHVLRAKKGVANEGFITGFLNCFDYTNHVTGSTRLKLTQGAMNAIPVRLAPLAEQKRIADKLEAVLGRVDACRARLDRVPDLLKRFRQSVLAAATAGQLTEELRDHSNEEDPQLCPYSNEDRGAWQTDSIPSPWRWQSFDSLFDDLTDSRRKLKQTDYEASAPHKVVDQGEKLVGGYSSRSDLLSEATLPVIIFGDHTRCIKWIDFPFIQGADGVKVLKPKETSISARYAHVALLACKLPDKGYSRHMKYLRATYFPVPPPNEQNEIVRRVEALFTIADRLEARATAARAQVDRLTPATLAKAFRGELVPQDPADEPASALLERLRAERTLPLFAPRPRQPRATGEDRPPAGR